MTPICEKASEFLSPNKKLEKVYSSWQGKATMAFMEVLEINLINACKEANDTEIVLKLRTTLPEHRSTTSCPELFRLFGRLSLLHNRSTGPSAL